jgi:Tfp pilus assembly protein PilN
MIAARRQESKQTEKRVRIMFLVVASEIAIGLAVMSFMTACVYSAGKSIEQTEYKLKKSQPIVNRIDGYTKAVERLQPKLKLLSDSRGATMLWCGVLHDLSASMPEKTWLTGLVTTSEVTAPPPHSKEQPETKVLLSLHGMSTSQRLVGDAMLRLSQCPELDKVNLNYTEKGNSAGFDGIGFDITAALKSESKGASANAKN